jgi:hypothetical protein
MSSGALLFGRYAFPPNRLGYCGPGEHEALFAYVSQQRADPGLVDLERRFEGAYPYLKLIAQANDIADPLDRRIVEAYWIGNRYLERVDGVPCSRLLDERSPAHLSGRKASWLAGGLAARARPHHLLTVFDIYMRAGMLRDARAAVVLRPMDSCRISWGEVVVVEGAELVVDRPPLVLRGAKLEIGAPEQVRVLRQIDGRGFTEQVRLGDHVSIHWNWACDVLSAAALRRLMRETQRALALVNDGL